MWLKANRSPAGARNLTLRCVSSASTRSLRVGAGWSRHCLPGLRLIQPGLYCEFVRRDGMNAHVLQLDGVLAPPAPGAARHWKRLEAAQNLRRVVEEDLVSEAGFEHAPVHLAPRFDHQRQIFLARKQFQHTGNADAAIA